MPIRDGEKFLDDFLGDTPEKSRQLLNKYDKYVRMIARKFSGATGAPEDDYYQEGIIGLARAARDWDPARSEKFRTFAIYKIKDAMKEYATSQAADIRVPQYIKDAQRLMERLRAALEKGVEIPPYLSTTDVWKSAKDFSSDNPIAKEVAKISLSLDNLASRSHTSVLDLLEKSEMMPSSSVNYCDGSDMEDTIFVRHFEVENSLIEDLSSKSKVSAIQEMLDSEEFDLLQLRFVDGYTVRELAPVFGVSAETLTVRTQKIIERINKRFKYENAKTSAEARA